MTTTAGARRPPRGRPAPLPHGAAIVADNLTKTYPGNVPALRGVTFDVEPGTVFGLLGPNGAGKSTTVKILTTLTRLDGGWATVAGVDVDRRPDAVRRLIGCVGQRSAVDVEATGVENLTLQGQLYGLSGRELRTRVADLLDRFGLADAGQRLTRTYSGGMQRKLDVAMGLVHRPQVLFLDEPTTGLDPEARAEMWHEVRRLVAEDGITILLTTHYLEEADQLAHRLAIVERGTVVVAGTPDELKRELHGEAISVDLTEPAPERRIREALAPLDGRVRDVSVDGRVVRARTDHGAAAVPGVLAALDGAGLHAASVTVARPSLDDVYLRHTGRVFEDADKAPARSESSR